MVERYPKIGEKIQTSTWATDFNGLFGERNFCMTDSEGKRCSICKFAVGIYGHGKGTSVKTGRMEIAPYGVGRSV